MNIQSNIPAQWWERIRWTRYGFFAGLFLGVLFGWFFHGVISLAIRFGLVLLLLLPLLVIGWLWLRSTRRQPSGGTQVVTWSPGNVPPTDPFRGTNSTAPEYPRAESTPGPTFTDVPFTPSERVHREEPSRRNETTPAPGPSRPVTLPDEVEAELQALKRQQESSR